MRRERASGKEGRREGWREMHEPEEDEEKVETEGGGDEVKPDESRLVSNYAMFGARCWLGRGRA